jgi:BirA family biotin operon repressor/biotin-[acetyl-CoA-carboxylase] ligase
MGPVKALGQDSLERAVLAAGIDVPPVWFDQVGSTNDEARALAEQGAPAWTVVAAGHQTAGRGRLGRSWTDEIGKSLLFSVLLRPTLDAEYAPLIGLMAAVEMIAAVGSPAMRAKWPNDLIIEGRKAGGILSEASLSRTRISHAVVGVGLNVTMAEEDFPAELRTWATSLFLAGFPVHPESHATLLSRFLVGFRRRSQLPPDGTLGAYRGACATIGRRVRATTVAGDRIEGVALDVDEHGALTLRIGGGHERVVVAEVEHLD